jgi:hypothetical protein
MEWGIAMAEYRNRSHGEGSPTGAFPSIREASQRFEPEMPRTLPEMPEATGVTGMWKVVSEGEDVLRQQDDSASANAPDDVARAGG